MGEKKVFINFLKFSLVFLFLTMAPVLAKAQYDPFLVDDSLTTNTNTVSMDFKDAKLNDVLKVFSQQSGLNFIASKDISDITVNLYLDRVQVKEALERILSANNLTYEIQPGSNVFVVKLIKPTQGLVTRVYPLKFATVQTSKLNKTFSITPQTNSTETSSSTGSTTTTTTTTDEKFGIAEAVRSVLSSDEKAKVIEEPRTNSLIVTDIPSQFPIIEQTIARLDVRVPEILIEVEMLDVSKGTADLLGAKWGSTPVRFNGAQKDGLFPFNEDNAADDIILADPGASELPTKSELFEDPQFRVSTLSFNGLAFTLQFLRTQTDTKNLARPRILTLNNETAEIKISTNEAIGSNQTTATSEGAAQQTTEAERVETGVFLTVTPQANVASGEITMAVQPRVVQARTGGTFNNITFKDPEERGTKSVLRIRDGDTIIIGGLLRSDVQDVRTKVPGLSKIPILGAAFRHKDKNNSERELIVFLTPHILREDFASMKKVSPSEQIVREQDVPQQRWNTISNELGAFEQKR